MGRALLITGLVVAFVLLDALLVVAVLRRAARRQPGLLLPFGLSIETAALRSNVRTLPTQALPLPDAPSAADWTPGAPNPANHYFDELVSVENRPVLDLTGEPAALRWPEQSVWRDRTSLDDATEKAGKPGAHSRPSAASNAE